MDKRIVWLCGLLLFSAGCVERRMTVVSDPPGAMVSVNNVEIGPAPVDVPSQMFIYHGYYDIKLVRDGYEPLVVHQEVPPKWYEYFPFDFVSELLVPWHIKDHRTLEYQMSPAPIVPTEQVLQTANGFRSRAQGIGTPSSLDPPPTASSTHLETPELHP